MSGPTGVILMTYGAPAGDADLPRYLAAVRGGKVPDDALVMEMARRYRAIGGSPLVEMTRRQAAALAAALEPEGFRVASGMRFSDPSIASAAHSLVESGCDSVVGICLSPQWSDLLMGGYERALREALAESPEVAVTMVGAWHRGPAFIESIASAIREALDGSTGLAGDPAVVLTAHSLPRRVFDSEPAYIAQLRETADLIAAAVPLAPERWHWAYQSAGHTAEEWLRPDLVELFPALRAAGHERVLVAPIQFLSDHLEVLYDLDIAAAEQARAAGLAYARTPMPNTRPSFIAALAELVRKSAPLGTARDATA